MPYVRTIATRQCLNPVSPMFPSTHHSRFTHSFVPRLISHSRDSRMLSSCGRLFEGHCRTNPQRRRRRRRRRRLRVEQEHPHHRRARVTSRPSRTERPTVLPQTQRRSRASSLVPQPLTTVRVCGGLSLRASVWQSAGRELKRRCATTGRGEWRRLLRRALCPTLFFSAALLHVRTRIHFVLLLLVGWSKP